MQSPFPFESMLVFGCLAIMLLIGVLLRAKIAFFQRFLMPSCLIGGILGLILINVNREFVPVANLEMFAYHFFNISFILVGLTRNETSKTTSNSKFHLFKAPLWMALTQSVIFRLQAISGGCVGSIVRYFWHKAFSNLWISCSGTVYRWSKFLHHA